MQREKALGRGDTVQPYLLVEGASLANINTVYVIIDTIRYQCKSVLEALDICFKSYHSLNGHYPKASEHILTLIQKAVYKINTASDKIYPGIALVLKFIKDYKKSKP